MTASVSEVTMGGYLECRGAKECLNEGVSGQCPAISVVFDGIDLLKPAHKSGLEASKVPSFFRRNDTNGDSYDTEVTVCQRYIGDSRVQEALRELAPELFVDDSDQVKGLMEAHSIASGGLADPDDVTTELGMEMLDRITSTSHSIFPSLTKLAIIGGDLTAVPVYETLERMEQ